VTALGAVALGLLLVLADFRLFAGVDVLPDVIGWGLVVTGTGALARSDDRFTWVRNLALLAAVLSLASLWHPVVTITDGGGDGFASTSSTGPVEPVGLHGALVSGHHAVAIVVTVLLSLRIRDRAREHAADAVARQFGLFAVLHAVLGAVVLVASTVAALVSPDDRVTATGGAATLLLALVLGGLAVHVWFIVALAGARQLPWLQPGSAAAQPR
jgi:hypothetical protein